ncbi:MAG: VCBS repeat-containing protein [Planctomycetota bacterium]
MSNPTLSTSAVSVLPISRSVACLAALWLGPLMPSLAAQQFRRAAAPDIVLLGRVTLADVDRDGDLDVLAATAIGPQRLALGDGWGHFTDASERLAMLPQQAGLGFVAGDFDGDGAVDLLFRAQAASSVILRNDGQGRFAVDARTTFTMPSVDAAVAGDFDGDGDLDLVLGQEGGALSLWLNDGTGRFVVAPGRLPSTVASWSELSAGDIDGDGDLDLAGGGFFSANYADTVVVYRNDGPSGFAEVLRQQGWSAPLPQLADLDGDGHLDLVVADAIATSMWRGDGQGGFGVVPSLPGLLRAVDVDDDGDLDLLGDSTLFVNDGSGQWLGAPQRAIDLGAVANMALGDVDSDGDLDAVMPGPGLSRLRLWINRHRGVRIATEPQIGQRFSFVVEAQPGYATTFQVVIPLLALGTAAIDLPPFGRLGLDPTSLVQFPLAYLPGPGGEVPVELTVPDVPDFVGIPLAVQGVVQSPLVPARLTNTETTRIR